MRKPMQAAYIQALAVVSLGAVLSWGSGLPKPSTQAIIKALQDSNLEVRVAAVQALTVMPDKTAIKPLENALIASADASEQEALVKALVAHDDLSTVKRLSDALANPQFSWGSGAKPRAIEVIGRIGEGKTVKWLTDLLASEQEPAVRAAAIRALTQIGAPPKKEEKK